MANEKNVKTPQEESNIDQINTFVTSSNDKMIQEPTEEIVELNDDTNQATSETLLEKETVDNTQNKHNSAIGHVNAKTKKESEIKNKMRSETKIETKIQKEPKIKEVKPLVNASKKSTTKELNNHKEHKNKIVQNNKNNSTKEEKIVKKVNNEKKNVETVKVEKKESKAIKHPVKNNKSEFAAKAAKLVSEDKMKKEKKENKNHKTKSKSKKNILMWIGIGVLAILLVVAIIIYGPMLLSSKNSGTTNETTNTVAATVNGEAIYLQAVMNEYDALNPVLKSMYTIESMLNKSIDEVLLSQEAKNRDIVIKTEDVQKEIDLIKQQNNLNDKELLDALQLQGMTLDGLKDTIRKSLEIRELLNQTILQNIEVSEEQIEDYYNANVEQFSVPEKVTVQHILVAVTANFTEEQSKEKIESINKELKTDNFCELVTKYTDDVASISTCGTYTFAKGEFNNPEFENPSFDLDINKTSIVKTMFGYHLIKKIEKLPAKTLELSVVSKDIETILHDNVAQNKFDAFLIDLREKAVVVNYLTKLDNSNTSLPTVNNFDAFAKCITANGAKFYGAYWCSHCNNQKTLFGDSMKYIQYVECAVEGQPQVQTSECTAAGISGYPTWIINGKSYPGEQTMANLAKLTGCSAP
ncbi:MAG: peptidylprolyl isomerase [Candidatus Woesearchaeota archaeon]